MRRNWPVLLAIVVGAVTLAVVVAWLAQRDDEETPESAFTVALGPSGEVSVRKEQGGWQFDLDVELPRLDDGKFYQAWLKADDGTLVPIGTFNEGDDVILWGGVSPVDYPTFTITREKADGNQDSSGDRVLAGEVVPAD